MKKFLLVLLVSCISLLSLGQPTIPTEPCVRYLTPCFTEWTSISGEYQPGYAFTFYMPKNDTDTKRPVIIFYTGGGTTDIGSLSKLCIEITKLGYVTCAAQYKKGVGDGFTEAEQKEAVINTYTLIRYIRENATLLGVKKKKMFGYGTSAGGITWINAGITANNTDIPFYAGIFVPNIKGSLIATASNSAAAIGAYFYLINPTGVQNNFYNGGKDPLIPWQQAQATYEFQLSVGINSLFHLYPNSAHGVGEHDDMWYNPEYGIIPTFYKKLNIKTPKP